MSVQVIVNIHYAPHTSQMVLWIYGRHLTSAPLSIESDDFGSIDEAVHDDVRSVLSSFINLIDPKNIEGFLVDYQMLSIKFAGAFHTNQGFAQMLQQLVKLRLDGVTATEIRAVEDVEELAHSPFDDTAFEAVHRRADDFFPAGGRGSECEPAFAMGSSPLGC